MMQTSFIAVQQLSKCVDKAGRLDTQCLRCLELVMAVEAKKSEIPEPPRELANGAVEFLEEDGTAFKVLIRLGPK